MPPQRDTSWRATMKSVGMVLAILVVLLSVLVLIGNATRSKDTSDSTTAEPETTWYSDLGPTDLPQTSGYVIIDGQYLHTPLASAANYRQWVAATGATRPTFGYLVCEHVRYGTTSYTEAADELFPGLDEPLAQRRAFVRAAMLYLCPA